MFLTPRLHKIASLVPKNSYLADIGTDHAYVPVYCVLNGICQRAIAMDINKGPLENAKETVCRYGVSDKVELRLSNGLEKLKAGEADVVVIAGMGGLLIKSIISAANLKEGTTLILQPMLAASELREYLYISGNAVENEYLAKEDEKIYNILVAKTGLKTKYTKEDIVVGRNAALNSPDIFDLYRSGEINKRKKILNGLKNARVKKTKEIDAVSKEIRIFENGGKKDED